MADQTDPALEEKFKEILPNLSLSAAQIEKMTSLQKSMLVQQYQQMQSTHTSSSITPEAIIKQLESGKGKEKTLTSLRTLLTTELVQWTNKFLELKGHEYIFDIFTSAFSKGKKSDKDVSLIAECCRCMKALMNTPEGMHRALEWEKSVELLFESLDCINIVSQEMVLYLLAALCFLSVDGHVKVLAELKRSNRFPFIMEFLLSKNEALVTSTLTFVNALIGAASDTQSRVEIRNEFLKMNIKELIHKERAHASESLIVQIKAFDHGHDEDLDTLIKAGAISASAPMSSANIEELTEKITKLESKVRSLEFENSSLKEENQKLKANPPVQVAAPVAAVTTATTDSQGAPPPPPGPSDVPAPPGGDGAPPPPAADGPPPPPPPGGGPPPPPPPPGGGPPPPPPPPGGGPPGPPPPPGGGPPGPPPPPGASGGPPPPMTPKRPAKPKCKPNKKMRAFGWNKIADAKIDNTIWEKTNDSKIKLDTLEFEALFGADEPAAKSPVDRTRSESSTPTADMKTSKKAPAIQLLDPKRSNNCEIMLRGLKMEPAQIREAILKMDEKLLPEDTLKTMKEYVPLPEEIQMLKDFKGDKANLGRAEKYMLAVMDIPKLSARLAAMAFKSGFAEKSELAKSEIQALTNAINSVRSSTKLLQVLELVLALGNYMNGSGNNGGCYGFRINSLNKMLDVKSTDGKMTLMHYLYDLISRKHKEMLAITEELSCTTAASRLNIRETLAKVAELKSGFATLEVLLNDPNVDSAFQKIMSPFAASAKSTIEQLESRSSKLEPTFKECVTYYGEPSSTEPEDFFGALSNFIESFSKAKADNEKRAAAAAKEAQSKALLAAVQSKQVAKKKGQIDDAIEGMKNGTMFARLSVALPNPVK